ncbi:MAG TPA: hypothetical protein DD433_07835 [Ruminococcaceae bacterium]|jgi:hypothetical protein|nr:hypothetical protein [Oscillospiraceae bacterium]
MFRYGEAFFLQGSSFGAWMKKRDILLRKALPAAAKFPSLQERIEENQKNFSVFYLLETIKKQ